MNLRFDFPEPVERIAREHAGGATLDELAAVCEHVAAEPGRSRKVELLAGLLARMEDDDLARAVRFLCGQPLPAGVNRRGSVGHAVLRAALLEVCGWDLETIRLCFREVGDTGETIGLLLHGKTAGRTLTLGESEWWFSRIYGCAKAADRVDLLRQVFVEPAPLALKYFVKVMTGNLRIGLQEKLVEEAVARATKQSVEAIREANNLLGRLEEVARAARSGNLQEIRPRLFHPMEFMLAKPLDDSTELDGNDWFVEDKYDGIRAQAHIDRDQVRFFTRGQEDATAAFPELAGALRGLGEGTILDGEILAWKNGRALSFNVLQQRLRRKRVPEELIRENPAVFMAYDLICRGGVMRTDAPLEQRRCELEELLAAGPALIRISPQEALDDPTRLEEQYREARERGNEGLLLKQRGSVYEAGKRSGAWRKVKRPYG
ncbi:MAG: hypothetical protein MUC42_12075, partial [Bryobacter sp.]|nr:hypothetical protein [Bryobacter sp.]